MSTTPITVDWMEYAQKYDMLLSYNPYYQEVLEAVLHAVKKWDIPFKGKIVDIGAGTGNYSVPIARLFPDAQILHIDNNKGMNARAAQKAIHLPNFEIIHQSIDQIDFKPASLHGLICINSVYTFNQPKEHLKRMHAWLAPGARAIFVDPGRIMNVFSWKVAISWHLLVQYGLSKTLAIFKEARSVAEQNEHIRAMQKNGTYWTHTHEEFCETVQQAGFRIEKATTCFRGDCDFVMTINQKT